MCASSSAAPGFLGGEELRLLLRAIWIASLASREAILNPVNGDRKLRIALAQVNPTVGALEENGRMIAEMIGRATESGADLVVFPELVLSGYPPDDLLFRGDFLDAARMTLDEIASGVSGIVALVGFPDRASESPSGVDPLTSPLSPVAANSVAVVRDGRVSDVYRKQLLPNYGVFDERRHFEPGLSSLVIDVEGAKIGITICEDIWIEDGPGVAARKAGADLIANCSASPFARGKSAAREDIVAARALESRVPVALCNLVGAQDELVFDGSSLVVGSDGLPIARSCQFEQALTLSEIDLDSGGGAGEIAPVVPDLDQVYGALCLGLHDYTVKNGFDRVVLGLSGGVDSAFVAMIAADALEPEAVTCVVMPSPHSSTETQEDAREFARSLGCELFEIGIEPAMEAYREMLAPMFGDLEPGLAEENLQARIRGNLVMALSNKFGWLPLATGNKSEMAVGYATLYGDMAGGFAPIKDVPKTLVYELIRSRGERGAAASIPRSIVDRAPSAELRPEQLDTDSLPDYGALDSILELYVDRDLGRDQIVAAGHDPTVVSDVLRMVDRAEYKRRQAPPGTRISSKAFGRDRRLPITNRYGSMKPLPR